MLETDPGTESRRRRPGHRGRIGVIQPAPGVLLEAEWSAYMPRDVLFPVGRIRMTGGSPDDYRRIADAAPDMAEDLVSAGADVIAYACSVGSLFAGPDFEARLIRRLHDASGKPVVSIADASMQALHMLGARRIAILSPYSAAVNALVRDYATQRGFTVATCITLPVDLFGIADVDASDIAGWAIAALSGLPEADALWIPCTAVRTLAGLDVIESATGRFVVSGTQALLWATLGSLGIDERLPCGSLFRHASSPAAFAC